VFAGATASRGRWMGEATGKRRELTSLYGMKPSVKARE